MGNNKKKKKTGGAKVSTLRSAKSNKIDFKRHILVACQALCGALIGVCFFLYRSTAVMTRQVGLVEEEYIPSLYEVSKDYYESDIYTENISASLDNIIRYVSIRKQMETSGTYDPEKPVNVCEYANRKNGETYEGIDVAYKLEDLIKWGQKAASETYSFFSYDFYTFEEYCNFFGLDPATVEEEEGVSADNSQYFTSFETLSNYMLPIDGENLEKHMTNIEDYSYVANCVAQSARDLYSNYVEYLEFKEIYSEENTNLSYCIYDDSAKPKKMYTNISGLSKGISDTKLTELFKAKGEYVYAFPSNLEFVTNMPVTYEVVAESISGKYGYLFSENTRLWFALDTKLPVEDSFQKNKVAFANTTRLIPFAISLGVVAFSGFFALLVIIVMHEKKRYSVKDAVSLLPDFDRLPIEAAVLFFMVSFLVLYLVETMLFRSLISFGEYKANSFSIIVLFLIFADIYVAGAYFYGLVRRILCHNIFEHSAIEAFAPYFRKLKRKLSRVFWRAYDSSGVAIRTWSSYILFLVVNVFFACLLFFSSHPFLSFFALFIIDFFVGVALFSKDLERKKILDGIIRISEGEYEYKIDSSRMHGENKELAESVNNIGLGLGRAVEISTKDEKLKADLITNVSHDIKTPLTSIINYVDLLKKININDERAKKYIEVLDEKSQRLKQLTFDLVEASKITSGNISIELIRIDFVEFLKQTIGEFEDKFSEKKFEVVVNVPSNPVYILADPRHMWRVIENLFNNIYKYAQPATRVYLDLVLVGESNEMVISIKNISDRQLNIPADELTERFIRGDVSRSTEGSGLGLSIAKSLTTAQGGQFEIYLDGDLFKVTLTFALDKTKDAE